MAATAELIGQRFGGLVVVGLAGRRPRQLLWRCVCDCGTETATTRYELTRGRAVSCGGCPRRSGSRHPQWRGGEIGYQRAHSRLGRVSGRTCVDCGRPALDWSLRQGTPQERLRANLTGRWRGLPFSTDPSDYEPRCKQCHAAHDGRVGERQWSAKLTEEQVREARAIYRPGVTGLGPTALAGRFGVSRTTMWTALRGLTWAHVKEVPQERSEVAICR